MNLYIGNLPFTVREQELQDLFGQFGEVSSVKVVMDRVTGRSKGFAFVEMPNDNEAQSAIDGLNGKPFKERALTVNQARPRE
ncbi:MAG: RNA-binding protein [Bacteroidetes bacterium]|nr:RNA-binding protein [Bacteroidota bacterium]